MDGALILLNSWLLVLAPLDAFLKPHLDAAVHSCNLHSAQEILGLFFSKQPIYWNSVAQSRGQTHHTHPQPRLQGYEFTATGKLQGPHLLEKVYQWVRSGWLL